MNLEKTHRVSSEDGEYFPGKTGGRVLLDLFKGLTGSIEIKGTAVYQTGRPAKVINELGGLQESMADIVLLYRLKIFYTVPAKIGSRREMRIVKGAGQS
jgi:hypothetical protein